MSNMVRIFFTNVYHDPEDGPGQQTQQSGSEGPFDADTTAGRESIEYVVNHRLNQMLVPDPEVGLWQYVQIVRVEEHATTSPVLNT